MASPQPNTRAGKKILNVSNWINVPPDHPYYKQYGPGAIRKIEYEDGVTETRFFHHGTGSDPDVTPESGYLVASDLDRDAYDIWAARQPKPPTPPTPPTPDEARAQAATATTAEELNRQRAANAAAGRGGITDAEWIAANDRQQQEARAAGDAAAATKLANDRLQFERDKEARPETNLTHQQINGQQYTTVTTVPKGGGAAQITHYGPDGKPIAALPQEQKGQYQPLPTGVPQFTPDLTQVDLGLGARRRQLDELINNGTISREQAAQAIAADAGIATAAGQNAGSIVNIQEGNRAAGLTARGQDVQDASSRRQFASSTFNQVASSFPGMVANFIPGPGAGESAARGFQGMLGASLAHAGAAGGMRDLPAYDPSQYPILDQFGRAGIPGLPGGPPLGPGWTFGQPAAGPGAAPAAGLPDLNRPAPAGTSTMPWFTPTGAAPSGADVAAQLAASQAASQAAFGALGIPGTGGPGPIREFDGRPATPMAPAVRPTPTTPIRDDWRLGPAPASPLGPGPLGLAPPVGMAATLFRRRGMGITPDLEEDWVRLGLDPDVLGMV